METFEQELEKLHTIESKAQFRQQQRDDEQTKWENKIEKMRKKFPDKHKELNYNFGDVIC